MEEQIRMELPGFIQSWYADELSMTVAGANILPDIARIKELRPILGFYLESENHNFCGIWGL